MVLWKFTFLKIEQTCSGHPFVELRHYALIRSDIEAHKVLDNVTRGITEKCGLNIIPVAV